MTMSACLSLFKVCFYNNFFQDVSIENFVLNPAKVFFSLHRKFSKMPPILSLPFADQTFLFFSILHQVFFQKIVISKLRFHVNTAPGLLQKHLLKTKFSQKMLFKTYFSHQYYIRSSSKLTFLGNIASGLPQN